MYGDFGELEAVFSMLSMVLNFAGIIFFISKAWGLYTINKKLETEHSWLSWIPVVNVYMWTRAANLSFLTYVVYPYLAIFIGALLAILTFGISLIAALIYFIWAWIHICGAISKRTGNGAWTTIGLFFIPFIILPVVGYNFKTENTEKIKEKKIEL